MATQLAGLLEGQEVRQFKAHDLQQKEVYTAVGVLGLVVLRLNTETVPGPAPGTNALFKQFEDAIRHAGISVFLHRAPSCVLKVLADAPPNEAAACLPSELPVLGNLEEVSVVFLGSAPRFSPKGEASSCGVVGIIISPVR